MKIIFSPAKEMLLVNPQDQDWNLSSEAQAVYQVFQDLDTDQIQSLFKLKGKKLEEVQAYLQAFQEPKTYPAISLYHGLAFRQLKLDTYSPASWDYLHQHLRILSAFYGPLAPNELIKPYRLDFQTPFKIRGQTLKEYWLPVYQAAFEAGEMVINLASQEFALLLEADKLNWMDIDFYRLKDGKKSRHSTVVKKARGMMLDYLVKHQIQTVDAIKDFRTDHFEYVSEESTEHLLVFRQKLI